MNDVRKDVYENLHGNQLKTEELANRFSANRILGILEEYLQPKSALDVGCGLGTWLSVMQERGIGDVQGIDGPWLKPQEALCDPAVLRVVDLETSFDLGRQYDLVVCLEVAEHLAQKAAEQFVECLVRHSSVILFSAAIPFQGGHHHVNEQFLSYWVTLFAKHEYQPLDIFRGQIWHDQQVLWWLRQNIVLFVHDSVIAGHEKLRRVAEQQSAPMSVVHPDVYVSRIQDLLAELEQHRKVDALLRHGGLFSTVVTPQGLTVTRLNR
jgi:SAM-dependent methyltransferase